MKTLCLSILSLYSLLNSIEAETLMKKHFEENTSAYLNEAKSFNPNFGIQLKFMSGLGLSISNNLDARSYIHFTIDWYFGIINFSSSYNSTIYKSLDLYGGLFSYINGNQSEDNKLFVYPEIGVRWNLSKKLYLEAGAILPLNSEEKEILMNVFGIPFIPNVGIRFNLN